jgi:adenylate kinase family enzyme
LESAPGEAVSAFTQQDKIRVVLLCGPGGAGKTSLASRVARAEGWTHISEDDHWVAIKRGQPRGTSRSSEEQAIVQLEVVRRLLTELAAGRRVVLEFILYENPPRPLLYYQGALAKRGLPFTTAVLSTAPGELLRRIRERGRDACHDDEYLRRHAEHQLACLGSPLIEDAWRIDTTGRAVEDIYDVHFRAIVERR